MTIRKSLYLITLILIAAGSVAWGQDIPHHDQTINNSTVNTTRVSFDKEAMSLVPPASFTRLPNVSGFMGDPAKYGGFAIFILSDAVELNMKGNAAAADIFEGMMKTSDYQKKVVAQYINGLGSDMFKDVTVDRTEVVTVNSLPTIKADLSMTVNGEAFSNTMLIFYHRRNDKAYYLAWFANKKNFSDFSDALKPAIASIEYK